MKFFYSNLLIVFFCCIIIIDQDAIFLFRRSFVGGVVVCGRLDGVESDDIHSIDDGFVQNAYKALWDRNLEFLLHKEKHERTDLWEQAKQMILFDLSHFMDLIWHQNAYRVDEWIN